MRKISRILRIFKIRKMRILELWLTLPDSLMMYQQTRYSGPAAKLKMMSGHHSTGSEHEVYLALPGCTRSTGTREYLPVTGILMMGSWNTKVSRWDRQTDRQIELLHQYHALNSCIEYGRATNIQCLKRDKIVDHKQTVLSNYYISTSVQIQQH